MKKTYEKRLARLLAKRDRLDAACKAASDVEQVRSLTEQLEELNAEIEETRELIAECELREATQDTEERQQPPADAVKHNANITASFAQSTQITQTQSEEDPTASIEYRTAFMRYFQRGIPIPAELRQRVDSYMASMPVEQRAGMMTDTDNAGAVIPVTTMREVINKIRKRYGNLYSKVTKLAVPGGVEFPVGELQADFHWITESTVSPDQSAGSVDAVSFRYHQLELRIAQSFLSAILSLEAFEAKIPEVIATAYMKAMDTGIVKGTGKGQMLGILNDVSITGAAGHTIAMAAADISNWTAWRKKFFKALPLGYRSGEFIFCNSTVDAYLETMADNNNNPIFRQAAGLEVFDGDAADPNGRFFGRRISLVEPDILPDFDTASSSDVIGIYWQPEDYAINENFGFMNYRYLDHSTNKWVNKAITVVDGKVLNPEGYYLITKA